MKKKLNDILVVRWLDAKLDSDWLTPDDCAKRPEDVDCICVGFFIREDKEFLHISPTIGTIKKSTRDRYSIPKGVIKSIQKLKGFKV